MPSISISFPNPPSATIVETTVPNATLAGVPSGFALQLAKIPAGAALVGPLDARDNGDGTTTFRVSYTGP